MASPFDRIMETIRPHLPGAMDSAIRQELFGVCRTFFDDSNVWTEDIDFTMPAGQTDTEIMPFSGMIIRLQSVTKEGYPILGCIMPDTVQGTIHFPTAPQQTSDYVATVVLTVSDPISRDAYPIVPVDLVTKHWQSLMYGILSNMMKQPAKPYTNLQLAAFYGGKFSGDISRAMNYANTGNTSNAQNWRFPQSFNRRR